MEDLIIKEQETREKIAEAINNSGLPAFMLEPILRDFYEQIEKIKQQQYEQAMKNRKNKKENKASK